MIVVSLYIKTDITSLPSVRAASTQILEKFNGKHPSILINNAGIGGGFGMLDCDVDRVRKVLDVNLISHWWVDFSGAFVCQSSNRVNRD